MHALELRLLRGIKERFFFASVIKNMSFFIYDLTSLCTIFFTCDAIFKKKLRQMYMHSLVALICIFHSIYLSLFPCITNHYISHLWRCYGSRFYNDVMYQPMSTRCGRSAMLKLRSYTIHKFGLKTLCSFVQLYTFYFIVTSIRTS